MPGRTGERKRGWIRYVWMCVPLAVVLAIPMECLWPASARKKKEWIEHYERGTSLIRSKRYVEAQEELEGALGIAEELFGPRSARTYNTLYNLGTTYFNQEKLSAAERVFLRAAEMAAEVFGPKDDAVVDSLKYLSEIYYSSESLEEGIAVSKRLLAIREETLGPDHPTVGTILYHLGLDYSFLEAPTHFDEAESYLLRALNIQERNLAPDDPALDLIRGCLKELYTLQGRCEEADRLTSG